MMLHVEQPTTEARDGMITEATAIRIAQALESIAASLQGSAPRPMIVAAPRAVASLDAFRERDKHCPGCGNLKGKRHNQGCPLRVARR